ncbi:hypothetical protein [Allomuricauda sp. CP2A]|jgi:hypothetical protein|uniref:hypothetical protein n=1 Tax=Allomuricauda sp. CP2A TaxID=1848189 RepID=UPI000832F352|nr:hypothetical protein [Muricauda sp. CP2A]
MKKVYAIVALALYFFAACSKSEDTPNPNDTYLRIPDPEFETVLIDQGIDSDGVVNQQMLRTDAQNISHLDLNPSGNFGDISDLTGIEGFVNLTYLFAGGQQLTDIDLSANTKLDTVYLQANYLTSIDLGNNPNLLLVNMESNELESIDGLSNATQLKKIYLSFNYMEELHLDNAALELLHMGQNLLKTIDISGAVNLKNLFMISNDLTAVDLSNNLLLETVLLSDNTLQTVDFAHNSKLTHLYISSNALNSLDVSNNLELVDLRADRNPPLSCIKIASSQEILTVSKSDYQELNTVCN